MHIRWLARRPQAGARLAAVARKMPLRRSPRYLVAFKYQSWPGSSASATGARTWSPVLGAAARQSTGQAAQKFMGLTGLLRVSCAPDVAWWGWHRPKSSSPEVSNPEDHLSTIDRVRNNLPGQGSLDIHAVCSAAATVSSGSPFLLGSACPEARGNAAAARTTAFVIVVFRWTQHTLPHISRFPAPARGELRHQGDPLARSVRRSRQRRRDRIRRRNRQLAGLRRSAAMIRVLRMATRARPRWQHAPTWDQHNAAP
jgi:hypothetical protein